MISTQKQKEYFKEAINALENKIESDKFIVFSLKGQLALLEMKEVPKETKDSQKEKATEKQIKFLCVNNIDHDSEKCTKRQASFLINRFKQEQGKEI